MRDKKLDRLFLRFRDKGDVRALSRVFDLTSRELLELAAHVTRDAAQAEDLLQATFLIAIERARQYDGERGVMPWLVGILTHEAKLWNRRAARRVEVDRLDAREVIEPSVELEARELSGAVIEALDKLPELYREVLLLQLRDGKSTGEIARELGRSPGTVRVQIHRGLELVRKALPVGLVAGAIGALAPRGLAAVRGEIVKQATLAARALATGATASTALTVVIGGIAMKKVAVVAAALVLAVLSWLAWDHNAPIVPRAVEVERDAIPEVSPETKLASDHDGADSSQRTLASTSAPSASNAPKPNDRGSLLVKVTWRADGSPAAGIGVDVSPERIAYEASRNLELNTGDDGTLRVTDLEFGICRVALDRGNDRYTETRVEVKPGQETVVELSVPEGLLVEGVVIDKHVAPVPQARVWMSHMHRGFDGHIVGRCDAEGRFRLRGMMRGSLLGARSEKYAPSDLVNLPMNAGSDGKPLFITLELLEEGGQITGTVRDASGAPLADARVAAGSVVGRRQDSLESFGFQMRRHADGSQLPRAMPTYAHTDAQGRFAIDDIERGEIPVVVTAKDWAPWYGTVHVDGETAARVDVRLQRGATISGHVRRADGTPMSKVSVDALGPRVLLQRSVRADEQGAYALTALAPGEYRIFVNRQRSGGAGQSLKVLTLSEGESTICDATLPTGSEIAIVGRVIDGDDKPLSGWLGVARNPKMSWDPAHATTDTDGRFAFTDCDEVLHTLEFRPPGVREEDMPSVWKHDVRPGSGEIVLRASAETMATAHVIGRVLATDARPIEDAKLQVFSQSAKVFQLFYAAKDTGRFDIGPLPPGGVTIHLSAKGYPYRELARRELAPNQQLDLGDLVQEAPGRLHARVFAPDGSEARDIRAYVQSLGGNGRNAQVEKIAVGAVDSPPLDKGTYELQVRAVGGAAMRVPFEIRAGEETKLEVRLESGIDRKLTFHLPDSDPVSRFVHFRMRSASGDLSISDQFDSNVEKTISATITLAPGDYTIEAFGEDHLRADARITVQRDAQSGSVVDLWLEKRD